MTNLEAPYGTEPLLEFDAFQIFQDDMPEYNSSLILVDSWAATEGQLFSESIPADLFVDPEGESPLEYVATLADFNTPILVDL